MIVLVLILLSTSMLFQNDVENGQMFLEYSSTATSGELGLEIGTSVIYEPAGVDFELTYYLSGVDPNVVYELTVELLDREGNLSAEELETVNPVFDEDE